MSYKKEPNMSWQQMKNSCVGLGKRLCRKDEVCTGDNANFGQVADTDAWLGVEGDNDWLQVGKSNHPVCKDHRAEWGPPSWGLESDKNQSFKYHKCCEDPKPIITTPIVAPPPTVGGQEEESGGLFNSMSTTTWIIIAVIIVVVLIILFVGGSYLFGGKKKIQDFGNTFGNTFGINYTGGKYRHLDQLNKF